MRELPILFSTPMVQALLAERKTMTRRTKGLDKINENPDFYFFQSLVLHATGKFTFCEKRDTNPKTDHIIECKPKYQRGDMLWVKETYYDYGKWVKNGFTKKGKQKYRFIDLIEDDYLYFDNPPKHIHKGISEKIGWYKRPSLFMPKAAARIWLKVTDIKVERLQHITEEDAIKEGIIKKNSKINDEVGYLNPFRTDNLKFDTAQLAFLNLWKSINGKESLELNPWVFAYTFQIISTTGKPESHE